MAYAALNSLRLSLMRVDVIRERLTYYEQRQFEKLTNSLKRLDDDWYRGADMSEINELDAKIIEAAWKLQDVIDAYQISQGVDNDGRGVEQEICSFVETAKKLRKEYDGVLEKLAVAVPVAVAVVEEDDAIAIPDATTIGLSDLSQQIISHLLNKDKSNNTEALALWGMAGIGKTHLARDIYHHHLIVEYFDLRLWVTVGQIHKSQIKNIFVDILARIEHKHRDAFKEKDKDELRKLLRNSLLHRTYLIVLDDIWSEKVIRGCKKALPHNQNDQCILVTTRLSDVAENYLEIGTKAWQMPFLSDEGSWNLFSQHVFANKPFPTPLEEPGRKIAKLCEGLPLLILTVGDILRGLDQTQEFWNKVADKKTSTFPDAFDRIYKVLMLSYDYLNQKFKAPFIYMGVFPQGYEIPVSKLNNLWEIEDYYEGLSLYKFQTNSLVIVCKRRSLYNGSRSCKLHCTYWYVCVTEGKKSGLFHVLSKLSDVLVESPRRVAVHNNMLFGLKKAYDSMAASTSLTRSLLFTGEYHQYPVQVCFNTMVLLKVLDALAIRFYEFPNEAVNLLLLSYLALTHNGEVPCSISKPRQLQTLILRRHHNIKLVGRESTTSYLPIEIWDLQKLEYLRIVGSNLADPRCGKRLPILSRLYMNGDSCTEGVLRGTPILKRLRIEIEQQPEGGTEQSLRCLEHMGIPQLLNSVKCVVVNPRLSPQPQSVGRLDHHLSNLPRFLRKLSLNGLGYPWEHMSVIGKLPHLRVLKLRCSAFRGPKWEIKSGEFKSLSYLLLEDIDVVHWSMEEIGFEGTLEYLIIRHCYKLKMIPRLGMFYRMKRMEVDECNPSLVEFAQKIKVNSYCQLVINSSWNL